MLYQANNFEEFKYMYKNHVFKGVEKNQYLKSLWNLQIEMNQYSNELRFKDIDYNIYNHIYMINLIEVKGSLKWEIMFSIVDRFGNPHITNYFKINRTYN